MTEKQIHDTAIRLIEGGREFYDGHWLKAIRVPNGFIPCEECKMDCLCMGKMEELCMELDWISNANYMLVLADGKRR